jgi:hypothetical protein
MPSQNSLLRVALIAATLTASWLGMQALHELGHVLGARLTGGEVARVILHPFTLSRTDLSRNPHPLPVVWSGPLVGALAPLLLWCVACLIKIPGAFLARFFAGFCLITNGVYIGIGSLSGVGDCGDLLRHGAPFWQLWLFGMATVPLGLWLWNGQGRHFGLGTQAEPVSPTLVGVVTAIASILFVVGLVLG